MALAIEKLLLKEVHGFEQRRPLLVISVEGKDSEEFLAEDLRTLFTV